MRDCATGEINRPLSQHGLCNGWSTVYDRWCVREPVKKVLLMCVHEHLMPLRLCGGCWVKTCLALDAKRIVCHFCRDCAEPHRCLMIVAQAERYVVA